MGVWPLKRQAQWKSTLLYFRGWQLGMGVGRADSCPKADSPPLSQRARAFPGEERGLPAETVQSAQTVILKWVTGGLTSVTLITMLVFSSRVGVFPLLRGQLWELQLLMLCLQSGHRAVNLSIWGGAGFQYPYDSSRDTAQNITYSP